MSSIPLLSDGEFLFDIIPNIASRNPSSNLSSFACPCSTAASRVSRRFRSSRNSWRSSRSSLRMLRQPVRINPASATPTPLDPGVHFIVLRAFKADLESGNSNEVSATVNPSSPGGLRIVTTVALLINDDGTLTIADQRTEIEPISSP